jgi:hypothetical protein
MTSLAGEPTAIGVSSVYITEVVSANRLYVNKLLEAVPLFGERPEQRFKRVNRPVSTLACSDFVEPHQDTTVATRGTLIGKPKRPRAANGTACRTRSPRDIARRTSDELDV